MVRAVCDSFWVTDCHPEQAAAPGREMGFVVHLLG